MCPGTNAQIIPVVPIIEVVQTLRAGLGKSADLVLDQSRLTQQGQPLILNLGQGVFAR